MTSQGTDAPVDAEAVRQLIAEALSATGELPTRPRLAELDKALRAEIARLTPLVQRRAALLPAYSREWYDVTGVLGGAEDATAFQLGTGQLVGAIHVKELARRLTDLQNCAGGTR